MDRLPIDAFIEAVRHMPDIEARQEVEKRLDALALQRGLMEAERARLAGNARAKTEFDRLGREITVIGTDNSCLRRILKEINSRMERINWGKAVTAIYGQEGFAACREWMAAQYERELPWRDNN